MRELVALAQARGFSDWEHTLFIAQVVANSSPNFSSKRRKQTNYLALNPYKKSKPKKSNKPILTGEQGDRILDVMSGASSPETNE